MTNHSVGTFLPCIYCEYDLRGLAKNAACPECGMPLQASVDLDTLGPVTSIIWVRRGLLTAAIHLCMMLICAGVALGFRGGGTGRMEFVLLLAIPLNSTLRAIGSWWMTIPCERSAPGGHGRMRLAVRAFALALVAVELLDGGFYVGGVTSRVGLTVHLSSLVLDAFWIASLGLYLGSIAEVGLAARIRRAAGLACLAFLLTAVVSFCDAIWPRGGPTPSWSILTRGVLAVVGILSVLWLSMEFLTMRIWYSRILDGIEQLRHQTHLDQEFEETSPLRA